MQWETVIGLEVHTQLNTRSKLFSGAANAFGAEPNTRASAVDLGLPGVLPVVNEQVINKAIRFGVAIEGSIYPAPVFARKNYFYPDLPKGYQISQFDQPIVQGGHLAIMHANGSTRTIRITRAHLEEDAGKSVHNCFGDETGIDLNRAGTPLLEIVSEADMRSGAEAVAYLKALHTLVRTLNISEATMQDGGFRCDVNLSVRPQGTTELGTRTELKNINSFRFIEKAIDYEANRQIDLLEAGHSVVQETRLYDAERNETRSMRSKEEAHDYRYFPDPDLLPVQISADHVAAIAADLPELPQAKFKRFVSDYGLGQEEATILSEAPELSVYFEAVTKLCDAPRQAANWIVVELLGALNRDSLAFADNRIEAEQLGQLINRINDHTISGKIAKQIFQTLHQESGQTVDSIIEQQGLKQISDSSELDQVVADVIRANPEQFEALKNGKTKLMGFFVGQVMKKTQGKANPKQVNELLQAKLNQ